MSVGYKTVYFKQDFYMNHDSPVYGLVQVTQARPFHKNMYDIHNNKVNNFAKKTEILIITACLNKCFVRTGDLNHHNLDYT